MEENKERIDVSALFKISYGLFLLSVKDQEKDNACIINTAMQISEQPLLMSFALNRMNHSHEILKNTKKCNISVLSEDTPFSLFQHFGYSSGKVQDKFADFPAVKRSSNDIYYLVQYSNAFFSAEVREVIDFPTHSLFVAEVTEATKLSEVKSATYQYYFDQIKPKTTTTQKGYICQVCNYIHEGETIPEDFICPICKHSREYFVQL